MWPHHHEQTSAGACQGYVYLQWSKPVCCACAMCVACVEGVWESQSEGLPATSFPSSRQPEETISLGVRVLFILYFLPQAQNSPVIWQFLANKQQQRYTFPISELASAFSSSNRHFKYSDLQIFHIHIVYTISQQSRRADRLGCCKRNMHANT